MAQAVGSRSFDESFGTSRGVNLRVLGWGIACLAASTASAGLVMNIPHVALAGTFLWVFAAGIHIAAAARRYLGLGGNDTEPEPVVRAR